MARTPYMEYNDLLALLESDRADVTKSDIYQRLMEKEPNTLNLIQRVVDTEQSKQQRKRLLAHMSMVDILSLFSNTWKHILHELTLTFNSAQQAAPPSAATLARIFLDKERKVVLGMSLILLAVFLFFVEVSNGHAS
jgi:hypothetical protein